MHRWHFLKLFRWMVPVFVLVGALCVFVLLQKSMSVGLSFADDEAYASLSVARSLLENHAYALQDHQPIPAAQDVLWRLGLAVIGFISRNLAAAPCLLGTLGALGAVLLCLKITRELFPFPPFILYSALLLIGSPCLVLNVLSGNSLPLAMTLVSLACILHIEGLRGRRELLPMESAFIVGLLAWLHVEFLLLWIVFLCHGLIFSALWTRPRIQVLLVFIRGLAGMALLALCMLPLILWNVHVISGPWPLRLDAPFTPDAGHLVDGSRYVYWMGQGFRQVYPKLYDIPLLASAAMLAFVGFGNLLILISSIWNSEERPFTLIPAIAILIPAFYSVIYPVVGWTGAGAIFQALMPLWIVAAAFGVFRIPFLLENLYRKWKAGMPTMPGFTLWWIVMGGILFLFCARSYTPEIRNHFSSLAEMTDTRENLVEAIQAGQIKGPVLATDQPGWLAYAFHQGIEIIDLEGRYSPGGLSCLNDSGEMDEARLTAYLRSRHPASVILWGRRFKDLPADLSSHPVSFPNASGVEVYAVNGAGVP